MPISPSTAYARRIRKVVDFIATHLDEELDLDRLARVAGFSKFHFHRQFTTATGYPVGEVVRRLRLKRAAYRLAFERDRRVLEIALEAGFGSAEAFSRAFTAVLGKTPTAFRDNPDWAAIAPDGPLPTPIRSHPMTPEIVRFEETRVAVLEHHGPQAELLHTVARFIAWRKASSDSPHATSRTFGIVYFDPEKSLGALFRFDVCGEIRRALAPNDAGVVEKVIPSGRCARVRHVGSTDAIAETVRPLYVEWLPGSGERLREFPLFFHYVSRMPQVAEHEQITDVYLPLAG